MNRTLDGPVFPMQKNQRRRKDGVTGRDRSTASLRFERLEDRKMLASCNATQSFDTEHFSTDQFADYTIYVTTDRFVNVPADAASGTNEIRGAVRRPGRIADVASEMFQIRVADFDNQPLDFQTPYESAGETFFPFTATAETPASEYSSIPFEMFENGVARQINGLCIGALVNRPPVPIVDSLTYEYFPGNTTDYQASFLEGFDDAEEDFIDHFIEILSQPTIGVAATDVFHSKSLYFRSNENASGSDSFELRIYDQHFNPSAPITIRLVEADLPPTTIDFVSLSPDGVPIDLPANLSTSGPLFVHGTAQPGSRVWLDDFVPTLSVFADDVDGRWMITVPEGNLPAKRGFEFVAVAMARSEESGYFFHVPSERVSLGIDQLAPRVQTVELPDGIVGPLLAPVVFQFGDRLGDEIVNEFERRDLRLTRDNGIDIPLIATRDSDGDIVQQIALRRVQSGIHGEIPRGRFSLEGLSDVTSETGTYRFTLIGSESGIIDLAGNSMTANHSSTFTVDTTAPEIADFGLVLPRQFRPPGPVTFRPGQPVFLDLDIQDQRFALEDNFVQIQVFDEEPDGQFDGEPKRSRLVSIPKSDLTTLRTDDAVQSIRVPVPVSEETGRQIFRLQLKDRAGNTFNRRFGVYVTSAEDVDGNAIVSFVDALTVINHLASESAVSKGESPERGVVDQDLSYDVNGDGHVSAIDALRIINVLAREASSNHVPIESIDFPVSQAREEPLVDRVFSLDETMLF